MLMRFSTAVGAVLVGILLLGAAPAFAQQEEMVVVTGSLIATDDADEENVSRQPYVSMTIPADHVIFTVKLETATRAVEEREIELATTFRNLAARASRTQGVTLEVGEPGHSSPLETTAAKEGVVRNRDRSFLKLVFKFSVRQGDTFGAVRQRAEAFVAGIQTAGRVEVVTGNQQYIGVSDARPHREALLRRIADDTALLQGIFANRQGAAQPYISLSGLEGRVKYRPSGPLELEIYIPYSVMLYSGGQPPR